VNPKPNTNERHADEPKRIRSGQSPLLNKGTAFTETERGLFHLAGLLPPRVGTLDEQLAHRLKMLRSFETKFERYAFLRELQDTSAATRWQAGPCSPPSASISSTSSRTPQSIRKCASSESRCASRRTVTAEAVAARRARVMRLPDSNA
jgi:hypothetical protein